MQFAGPLNPGDMAVRTNEVAPGVAALLKKESRNNRGIYELPVAKPENPDFYNMSLDNVQSQLRNFARTINTLAPEGESLAYINPKEAGILKLLGGSGEPEPVTGIPSFYITDGKEGGGISKGMIDRARNLKAARERNFNIPPSKPDRDDDDDKPTSGPTGPADTQFQLNQAGLKAAIEEDRLSNLVSSLGVDPDKKFTFGDQTITSPGYNPIKAAEGIVDLLKQYEKTTPGAGKEQYDAAVDALKSSLAAYDYGGKDIFGNTMLGDDTKNILRAAKTFGQLPRDKNFVENVADLFGSIGVSGILSKLFGSGKKLEDMSIEELKEFYDKQDAMMAAEEMRRRNRGGGDDNKQTPAPSAPATETEDEEEEEEIDFFSNLQRRFNMPITLESLRNRFMTGDPNRQNLLENLSDAVDRAKEENEAST